MPLWRVDINQIAHRFVEADTAESAQADVTESLVSAMDLKVAPAETTLAHAYAGAGPIQRKRMLAALDGLVHPHRSARDMRADRRRLARRVLADMEQRAWAKRQVAGSPPLADPEAVARLLQSVEVSRMEGNMELLRDDGARSPFYS